MKKPRVFIHMHYMEIGGAERALLGLLNALDPARVVVDLFLNQHTGEFLSMIPPHVNLLPEVPLYTTLEHPVKDIVKEGHWGMAFRRLRAKHKARRYHNLLQSHQQAIDGSVFQFYADELVPRLPSLYGNGLYDLAISFLQPHNIVLSKVNAKRKLCWIHTDYSTVHINRDMELPVWSGYDKIVSISPDCTKGFIKTFPELSDKIIEVENILSSKMIVRQAEAENVDAEMTADGAIRILSIGRFSYPKNFESIPEISHRLTSLGIKHRWFIIGYGPESIIRENIAKFGVEDTVVMLGKQTNPYPYMKVCDVYVQPSRYEGKCVAVREAQLLRKPVIITDYPTASSQINNGVDGFIVPLQTDKIAEAIAKILNDRPRLQTVIDYLTVNDLSNISEVEKIYRECIH